MAARRAALGVAGAALMISVLTLLARLAGFGRTLVFTNAVGAGSTGDTYLVANSVPNIVYEVVAGGALASLVVPMLAGGIAVGDREQVRRTASALLGWVLLLLVPMTVLLVVLARPIAAALLGGDSTDPAKVDLAARFLVVFAPQVVLYGLGIVFTGILQAHRRFVGPAIVPLLSSVVVAAAYLLYAVLDGGRSVDDLDHTAELVLGVGTTLGVVALTLPLMLPLRHLHLGLRPALRFPVGAAPRVRRLAVAGVVTLAGQQLVALVAIRLANAGAPEGTQVVYLAGMAMFLLPWAAVAVPLATSVYPELSATAEADDEAGYRSALAPVTVLTVVGSAVAAAGLIAVSGPVARLFLASGDDADAAAALQGTIAVFALGLVGYGLVALLTRALYARGLWRGPTACVTGGWLVAVAADLVLSAVLPAAERGVALAAGHSIGVTVAGLALLVVTARAAGAGALTGLARTGLLALAASALAAVAGLWTAQALGATPVPRGGLPAVVGTALAAGGVVLAVAGVVMMGTARGPLTAAVRALRGSGREGVTGG